MRGTEREGRGRIHLNSDRNTKIYIFNIRKDLENIPQKEEDEQTSKQADIQTDRKTDRQTHINAGREVERQTDGQTDIHNCRWIGGDRQTDEQTGRQTNRQRGRRDRIADREVEETYR